MSTTKRVVAVIDLWMPILVVAGVFWTSHGAIFKAVFAEGDWLLTAYVIVTTVMPLAFAYWCGRVHESRRRRAKQEVGG